MTAAYRTSGARTGVTTPADFTIPAAPTAQVNDVMYVAYAVAGLETVTGPAGFEILDTPRQDSGDTWVLARKVLTEADLGAAMSFDYTDPLFPHAGLVWMIISGADTATPEDAPPVWNQDASGTAAHQAPGIDTVTDGAYVLNLMMERAGSANASFTTDAGTIRASAISSGGSVVEGCAVDHGTTTPGTGRGAATITAASVATTHCGIWTIAVKPATSSQVVGLTADVDMAGQTAVPSGATQKVDRIQPGSGDASYIESSANPSGLHARASVSSALSGPPARVRVRGRLAAGATGADVVIKLVETTGGVDTVIAQRTETGFNAAFANYLLELTGTEMAAIGDWTQLDVDIVETVTA